MKSIRRASALLLVFLLGAGAAGAGGADPALPRQAIEEAAPAALDRHGAQGASVAMVLGGEVAWAAGFGAADARTGAPVTADTRFEIASLTKPVTAWAILKLAEAGRLDLDAPISDYLRRWQPPWSAEQDTGITARAILAHAAGLSSGGDPGTEPGEPVPSLTEAADGAGQEGGAIAVIARPGERYVYSSKGYILLEMAVEDITGERFAEYVEREVLMPLGMTASHFEYGKADHATGHDWYGDPLPRFAHATRAQGGLISTSGDIAGFVAASFSGPNGEPPGRGVISPDAVALTFRPYPFSGDSSLVGLGYNLQQGEAGTIARKSGSHRGFKAILFSLPDIRAGLVILTNSDRAAAGVFADIACPWSAALSGDPLVPICRQLYLLRNAHAAIATVLAGTGLLIAGLTGRSLLNGRRAPGTGRSRARRAGVVIAASVTVMWWAAWYSDLPLQLFGFPGHFVTVLIDPWPTAFVWVSWGVTVLMAGLATRALTYSRAT